MNFAPEDELHLDYETKSVVDLKTCGIYRYAEHPLTDILCMAYAFGNEPIQLWIPSEPFPQRIIDHIKAGKPIFAHNSQFERLITEFIATPRYGCPVVAMEQWYCTAAMAAAMALPRALDGLAIALRLNAQKDKEGAKVMKKMTRPRKTRDGSLLWWDELIIKGKTEATRQKEILKHHTMMERLYAYCRQDVETEREAATHLYPLSENERGVFLMDQRLNDRGIKADLETTDACFEIIEKSLAKLDAEIATVTGGRVTGVSQAEKLTSWFASQGLYLAGVDKVSIAKALKDENLDANVRRALMIRKEGAKSSTAKLKSIRAQARTSDGRVQGNLLYHGATTGRWAGKGVQLQNLIKAEILKLPEKAIAFILKRVPELLELLFGPPMTIVADSLRGLFMAKEEHDLIAADFNAIEARVLAWLAGEKELVEIFQNDGDVYCAFASRIYGRTITKKDKKERQYGKTCILGLGFQMGAKKFLGTCEKDEIFLTEEEAKRVVTLYRNTYKKISAYWKNINDATVRAVQKPGNVITFGKIKLTMRDSNLRIMLPSGRVLNYPEAKVVQHTTPWGAVVPAVEISAQNAVTRKWERTVVTPGTWTENVVQAIARDLMVDAMIRMEYRGYAPVLSVHDEAVSEIPEGFGSVEEYEKIMEEKPAWGLDIPIKAEGWRGKRYRK